MRKHYNTVNIIRVKYSSHCSNFLVIKMSSMTFFMCLRVCMWVCVHACTHAHTCSCVWKPEVNLEYCYSGIGHIPFFYFEKNFSLAQGWSNSLGLQASPRDRSACLPHTQSWGDCRHTLSCLTFFFRVSEGEAQAPMLAAYGKTLAN